MYEQNKREDLETSNTNDKTIIWNLFEKFKLSSECVFLLGESSKRPYQLVVI